MIHLFNSCYLYPDILFESSVNFVIVGENNMSYGANIDNSLYHMNSKLGKCLGRFNTYEDMYSIMPELVSSDEKTVIFADDDEFVKIYSSFLKTQIKNLNTDAFKTIIGILAGRLNIRNKFFLLDNTKEKINLLIQKLVGLTTVPNVQKINVDETWVKQNAGLEWKLVSENFENVDDIAPFKQFNSRRFEQKGLGIGLHLTKQLVGYNGGILKIKSIEDEGTKVIIELPLLDAAF